MGDTDDLSEHVFHHDMSLGVNEVVCTDDRVECVRYEGVGGGIWQRRGAWDNQGRDGVATERDFEVLSGLENQDEKVISIGVCESAPSCWDVKDPEKEGYASNQPREKLRQR